MSGPAGWDRVVEGYRTAFENYPRMRPTLTVMLKLAATLRNDPRFVGIQQELSHLNLMMWRESRDRKVGVLWSEPDGFGWSGEEGFAVFLRDQHLETCDRVIVGESMVVTTLVDYLDRLG